VPTPRTDAAPEARSGIQVIERMMKLLDVLSYHPDPVSLKQLALETGLHPSTAHRILAAMAASGFVERADPGTYRLGIRLLELGNVVKSRISIGQAAMPLMQRLHQQLGESVNLGVRQGDEIVYVERTSSGRSSVRVVHLVGARAPLHVTAVGKLYLAEDGPQKLREYARRTGLPGYTPTSLTTLPPWNGKSIAPGATASPSTTRKSSRACAASPPRCATTAANWSPACPYPPRRAPQPGLGGDRQADRRRHFAGHRLHPAGQPADQPAETMI
jgi:DNA-binding IclR family transcriptional regulator